MTRRQIIALAWQTERPLVGWCALGMVVAALAIGAFA
jgi:hypothetical protein